MIPKFENHCTGLLKSVASPVALSEACDTDDDGLLIPPCVVDINLVVDSSVSRNMLSSSQSALSLHCPISLALCSGRAARFLRYWALAPSRCAPGCVFRQYTTFCRFVGSVRRGVFLSSLSLSLFRFRSGSSTDSRRCCACAS